ncbi:MAG: winged helix-turn-helix domain-containing protein [Candidatus Bilamarchaeaceae archaeon]
MAEEKVSDAIVMDKKTFKSLTSETRLKILKLLKERNHTITEIAEKLGISKSSAKEHIEILVDGRLVEPVPSSNIWKYYKLTKDGLKLVGGETPQSVVILLATAVIGFLMMIYGFSYYFLPPEEGLTVSAPTESHSMMLKTTDAEIHPAPASESQIEWRSLFGFIGILLILLVVFEISRKRRVLI